MTFPVGTQVRLLRDVERYPDFVAAAGLTGTVVDTDSGTFAVCLDAPLAGASEWGNCILWCSEDDTLADASDDLETI
jgi:hypothetical protein